MSFVRHLRRNMTDAERRLWAALRGRRFEDVKFRRQAPLGRSIADFVCFARRLIVEVDGSQHRDSARDVVRDRWLAAEGFRVLRFWNVDALQALDGTLLAIRDGLDGGSSSAALRHRLPHGEKDASPGTRS